MSVCYVDLCTNVNAFVICSYYTGYSTVHDKQKKKKNIGSLTVKQGTVELPYYRTTVLLYNLNITGIVVILNYNWLVQ